MKDEEKTKEQLIAELQELRRQGVTTEYSSEGLPPISGEGVRYFVENASDIFYGLTPEGIFTYVSPNWRASLGHDPRTVVGRPFQDFVHPDDVPLCENFIGRTLATGKIENGIEYRVQHADGTWRWHVTDASPLHDADGQIHSFLGICRDITKYRQAQEALRESEEKYRLVLENAGEAILIAQDGKIILANRRAEEVTGYSEAEWQAGTLTEFIHPEDRARIAEYYAQRMRGGIVPASYRFRAITKKGAVRWVENHAFPAPWNGRPAILNFFLDITDRLQTEESLRTSELLYQTIFENTGTTMMIIEEDMTISLASDRFKLTGYPREEIEGKKKWTEFVAKEDLDRMVALHQLRRETGSQAPASYEFRLLLPDGSRTDMLLTIALIPGTKRSIASLMDITDRKRAEAALKESEEKYRTMLENINDGYFEVDLRGNLTFGNRVLSQIMGYPWEELRGVNYRDYVDPESQKLIAKAYREVYEQGLPGKMLTYEIITKNGVRIPVETSVSLRKDGAGQPAGFRGIARDVRERRIAEEERKDLEERLQRAEKMEAIGMLAGGVAHDLNNVLGILVGYSELILDKVDESSAVRPHVLSIMTGAERAAAIVQDLLTLARRGVHTEEVVNLNTVVRDFQKAPELEKLCTFHPQVLIKTDLTEGLLNTSGSPFHLEKTLFNLVSNAAEAMPNGGTVTIATKNQYLDRPIRGYDDVREGDYCVLTVADTGQGIAPADLKHIFEPFYTKKVMGRSGTGLGLSVVWGTVKDHNGYIDVRSEEERGSRFDLYFPVSRQELSQKPLSSSESSYLGNGESLLVVDDVAEQRDLASLMLEKLHYRVTAVSSGEKALEYLEENLADLLVLDMIMDPGMDGLETYKKVLEMRPGQKAVIVSGFSETDRVKEALALGAGAYVRKPYILETLGLAIRKELNKK
ncbi:MAG: PAS domain S-box protein [Deltaproteobacteria bacterium]|nr:PAS domain S-box protein [Deltaproteobacteria bacterium]